MRGWLRVWRERDGQAYAELLHEDCVFDNPIAPIPRAELPRFVDSLLAVWPDHRIEATRWAVTDDGVLIEWVATGTLAGSPIELRGAARPGELVRSTSREPMRTSSIAV